MANQHSGMKMTGDVQLNGNTINSGTSTSAVGVPIVLVTEAYTAGATGTIASIDIPADSLEDKGDVLYVNAVLHCTAGVGETVDLRVGSTTIATEADADAGEMVQLEGYVVATTATTANFAAGKVVSPAVSASTPVAALGYDITAAVTISIVTGGGTYTVAYFQAQRLV